MLYSSAKLASGGNGLKLMAEGKELKKLDGMADSLRDAGKQLNKVFLTARETEDGEESSRLTSSLRDRIDRL